MLFKANSFVLPKPQPTCLQGVDSNYETDLIFPIIARCCELLNLPWEEATGKQKAALKMIGDHARAVAYLVADGVVPASTGRGWVWESWCGSISCNWL